MMTRDSLIALEGKVISEDEMKELYKSEIVINFQNCGKSGLKKNCIWLIITLIDGMEINIYVKEN